MNAHKACIYGDEACFYGDDFISASENLARFHRHGLKCKLYLEPADRTRVRSEAPELDVVGIAGVSRSQCPAPMRHLLENAFSLFASLGTRPNQYKVCSIFDSAPQVGNFAVAIEVAKRLWPDAVMPPELGLGPEALARLIAKRRAGGRPWFSTRSTTISCVQYVRQSGSFRSPAARFIWCPQTLRLD